MSKIDVDIQIASQADNLPEEASLSTWCEKALMDDSKDIQEVTVRIVDEDESAELNYEYRGKESSTNVLSFPFEAPPEVEINLLGDLIICAPVVAREAKEQGKSLEAHWAHMVIHGMLHLQGYDHIDDAEAEVMEGIETKIILALGYPAPYENDNDRKNGN